MAAKILHGSLSLLLVIIHGRGKGIREIKAPLHDSRCIVFCNFTVSLSRREEERATKRRFLKLISILVRYFRSCVYMTLTREHTYVCVRSLSVSLCLDQKKGETIRRKREKEKAESATSVKSTGVPRKFLSKRLPLRKTLLSHVERKSGCSGRKTNGQVMAFVLVEKGKRASRATRLRNHDEDGDGWLRYHDGSGEARPCRRREFRHGRHGSREETANRITLGGRGRFLTVDLPPDTPPLAHSNPPHSSHSPRNYGAGEQST